MRVRPCLCIETMVVLTLCIIFVYWPLSCDNCSTKNVTVIDILANNNYETASKVDILLVKLTDDLMQAREGSADAVDHIARVNKFIAKNPQTLVIERLERMAPFLDRKSMNTFLNEKIVNCSSSEPEQQQSQQQQQEEDNKYNFTLKAPIFAIIRDEDVFNVQENDTVKLDDGKLQAILKPMKFPMIVKSLVACGPSFAHEMAIAFNEQGLKQVLVKARQFKHDDNDNHCENHGSSSNGGSGIPLPVMIQHFVNHDALIYKIYVLGKHTFAQTRPSIRNFSQHEGDVLYFNSQTSMPELLMDPKQFEMKKQGILPKWWDITDKQEVAHWHEVSQVMSNATDMHIFGYDVCIENNNDDDTGNNNGKKKNYYIVDFNYFPGYKGITNVHELMLEHLLEQHQKHQQQQQNKQQ